MFSWNCASFKSSQLTVELLQVFYLDGFGDRETVQDDFDVTNWCNAVISATVNECGCRQGLISRCVLLYLDPSRFWWCDSAKSLPFWFYDMLSTTRNFLLLSYWKEIFPTVRDLKGSLKQKDNRYAPAIVHLKIYSLLSLLMVPCLWLSLKKVFIYVKK